jgi:hypothetical protein
LANKQTNLHKMVWLLHTLDGNTDIRAVKIVPPSVGTNLHREREDPDDNKEGKGVNALTIDEFIMEIAEQTEQDKEVTSAGMGVELTGGTALWGLEVITKQQRPILPRAGDMQRKG